MKIDTLTALYVNELRDLHDAETQLQLAIPRLARAARTPDLSEALLAHAAETASQALRLRDILAQLGHGPEGQRCEAMAGLVSECTELIGAEADPAVRDAGLVVAAQKIEHYEIAAYGSLCAFARLLGRSQDADLLHVTLEEEKKADRVLTELAEQSINAEAVAASNGGRREGSWLGRLVGDPAEPSRSSGMERI